MKKTLYIIAFAIFLAASCQREELPGSPEINDTQKTLAVGVADEADSRVGFDENKSFYWHQGDRIGVMTSAGFREMVLGDQYHKKAVGVFTGNFAEDIGEYVIYLRTALLHPLLYLAEIMEGILVWSGISKGAC